MNKDWHEEFENYFSGAMGEEERILFNKELSANEELRTDFEIYRAIELSMTANQKQQAGKDDLLASLHELNKTYFIKHSVKRSKSPIYRLKEAYNIAVEMSGKIYDDIKNFIKRHAAKIETSPLDSWANIKEQCLGDNVQLAKAKYLYSSLQNLAKSNAGTTGFMPGNIKVDFNLKLDNYDNDQLNHFNDIYNGLKTLFENHSSEKKLALIITNAVFNILASNVHNKVRSKEFFKDLQEINRWQEGNPGIRQKYAIASFILLVENGQNQDWDQVIFYFQELKQISINYEHDSKIKQFVRMAEEYLSSEYPDALNE